MAQIRSTDLRTPNFWKSPADPSTAGPYLTQSAYTINKPRRLSTWRSVGGRLRTRFEVAAVLGRAHDPFEAVGGGLLVDFFNRRELAGQTVEGRLVHLPFAKGLIALIGVAAQVAHHFGD